MNLALFDFDSTITKEDSLLRSIRFVVGDVRFVFGVVVLSPILLAHKFKLVPGYKAKQKMVSWYFKGMGQEKFLEIAKEYSLTQIDKIVRKEAMQKIAWHKAKGHKVIVVSASMDCWMRPWCEKNGLELIATKLEFKDGIFTGKFATKNCKGAEKVNRMKEEYNLAEFDKIYITS